MVIFIAVSHSHHGPIDATQLSQLNKSSYPLNFAIRIHFIKK